MQDWQLRPARNLDLPLNEQFQSVQRESGLLNAGAHLAWSVLAAAYLKLYHRLSIEGRENLPVSGSFVLAANHASHLDSLVLASAISWKRQDQVFPVAAGDTFFSTSLKGTFSALLINALPLWRKGSCSHGIADLRQRLALEQCIYIIFPEGTRTRTGRTAEFKPGIGMLVASTNIPVVPCRLIGTFEALPCNRRWPKPRKVRLRIGRPISFPQLANDRDAWRSAAKSIEAAVDSL